MKKGIILLPILALLSGCVTTGPMVYDTSQGNLGNVLIASTLDDQMIMSYRGTTIFSNNEEFITELPFDINRMIETKIYELLKDHPSTNFVVDEDERNIVIKDNFLDKNGNLNTKNHYDAVLIIVNGSIRRGLAPESGPWVENFGIFKNETIFDHVFSSKDFVVCPISIGLMTPEKGIVARSSADSINQYFKETEELSNINSNENLTNSHLSKIGDIINVILNENIEDDIRSMGLLD